MRNCIDALSQKVLGKDPHYTKLTAIYRNTRKVVSFLQCTIQDSYDDSQTIECQNMETGDGMEYIRMTDIWTNSPRNELVQYLQSTRITENYKMSERAILLDPSYTSDQIEECRNILRENIPNSGVQSAHVFPRNGIVVDSVNSFLGLDAPLCVFILPCNSSPKETKSKSKKEKRSIIPLSGAHS